MLYKFENPEAEIPATKLDIMQAWAELEGQYRMNYLMVMRESARINMQNWIVDPDSEAVITVANKDFAVQVEAALQDQAPELVLAMQGLKTAIDKVTGWHIRWRHAVRGDIIDARVINSQPGVVAYETVRAPYEYPENEGWIVSSRIGPDKILGGINAWVEVGYEQVDDHGVNHMLGEMFAIELTEPNAVQ